MSAFADVGAIGPQQIWAGVVGRTVHGNRVTLSLIELEPNADVPEHSHENEQVGILLEGSLSFRIGDETKEVAPGGTWTILAHVPHSVTAGPEGSVLVEVFSPTRDDWHGLEDVGAPTGPLPVERLPQTELLERAKSRLDTLSLYPHPVRIDRVRLVVSPFLFRLPWFRRFDGYATWTIIFLCRTPARGDDDLVCHELCHVWQMQHHPISMPLSYLRSGYAANRYEAEARLAVSQAPAQ